MRNAKRLLALTVALASVMSFAACGKNDSSTAGASSVAGVDLESSQVQNIVDAASSALTGGDSEVEKLENPTVQWISHYDINPADGKVEDPAIALFRETYGGEIEWVQTDWNSRYTKLASLVSADTSPDMFPADDMDAFPMGAIKQMFQPIDSALDLSEDIWADQQESIDKFSFAGGHYVAVIETQPNLICLYNTETIDDMGLDQPADLYWNGEWTWEVFYDYCVQFNDPENDKYALDGFWWWDGLTQTTGKSYIDIVDGKVVSNVGDPLIEEAQNFVYELTKAGSAFPRHLNDWATRGPTDSGSIGLGSGLTLFIPVGPYEIEDTLANTEDLGSIPDGEVMFVPLPAKDTESETYMSSRVNGYCLVTGAKNPEGYAAFMRCKKICATDESIRQIGIDTLTNDYGWTEEMLEMREECYRLSQEKPVFEFYNAISQDMTSVFGQLATGTSVTNGEQKTWAELREANMATVDYFVDDINSKFQK